MDSFPGAPRSLGCPAEQGSPFCGPTAGWGSLGPGSESPQFQRPPRSPASHHTSSLRPAHGTTAFAPGPVGSAPEPTPHPARPVLPQESVCFEPPAVAILRLEDKGQGAPGLGAWPRLLQGQWRPVIPELCGGQWAPGTAFCPPPADLCARHAGPAAPTSQGTGRASSAHSTANPGSSGGTVTRSLCSPLEPGDPRGFWGRGRQARLSQHRMGIHNGPRKSYHRDPERSGLLSTCCEAPVTAPGHARLSPSRCPHAGSEAPYQATTPSPAPRTPTRSAGHGEHRAAPAFCGPSQG